MTLYTVITRLLIFIRDCVTLSGMGGGPKAVLTVSNEVSYAA